MFCDRSDYGEVPSRVSSFRQVRSMAGTFTMTVDALPILERCALFFRLLGGVTWIVYLVGGFNPSEKYSSKWKSSPNRGENKKCLKPLFSTLS